jgi:predicted SAM-dependent methyltransferase
MSWSLENSKNDESAKVRWELVRYMNGHCLDLGAGPYRVFPHFVGIDNGHHWGHFDNVRVDDAADLRQFASASWDVSYSSHLLEHFPYEKVPAVLEEWLRVIRPKGFLILYLPDSAHYPLCGSKHANPDHKWDVTYEKVVAALEKSKYSWDIIDFQERNEKDEYSLLFVIKKL